MDALADILPVAGNVTLDQRGPTILPLPEWKDAADLISDPPSLPPVLVEGLLQRGTKMVLGGSSKCFKS